MHKFTVLEMIYQWCSRGIWQMPAELKKGVNLLCGGRYQEVRQWDLDSPSPLKGKRMKGWAGKADFLVYSVRGWHLCVWECGLFNWLLAPVHVLRLDARRLNPVRAVKGLSERVSLTGYSDTGTKKKKVNNNHHLTYSGDFSWHIALMLVSLLSMKK